MAVYSKIVRLFFKEYPLLSTARVFMRFIPYGLDLYWSWVTAFIINAVFDSLTKGSLFPYSLVLSLFAGGQVLSFLFSPGGFVSSWLDSKFNAEFGLLYDKIFRDFRLNRSVMVLEHPVVSDALFKIRRRVGWRSLMERFDMFVDVLAIVTSIGINIAIIAPYYPALAVVALAISGIVGAYRVYVSNVYNKFFNASVLINRLGNWAWWDTINENAEAVKKKALGLYKYIVNRFAPFSYIGMVLNYEFMVYDRKTWFVPVHIWGHLYSVVVLYVLIKDVLAGVISVGQFSFFRGRIGQISAQLSAVVSMYGRLQRDIEYYKLFFELYEGKLFKKAQRELVSLYNISPPKQNRGIKSLVGKKILIKDLWFKYKKDSEDVIKGISLSIPYGKNVAIVGPNGAGKTTLIKVIMGQYPYYKGSVKLGRHEIKDLNFDSVVNRISYLPQDVPTIGYFTVYDLITVDRHKNKPLRLINSKQDLYEYFSEIFGISVKEMMFKIKNGEINDVFKELYVKNRGKLDKNVLTAAQKARAHEFIVKFPLKYFTPLDATYKNGVTPSLGQWQRMHIARVFYTPLDILILDEPTSAVDPDAAFSIMDTIFETFKKQTVIIISHRYATIMNADYVYVLDSGKIVEQGTPKELVKAGGYFAKAYEEELKRLKQEK